MGQNNNVRDYQNRNQENNVAVEITAEVTNKKNFIQRTGDMVKANPGKTAAVVGGVGIVTAYICRAKKTGTWKPWKKAFWKKQAKETPAVEQPAE